MKTLLIVLAAIVALASCTNDEIKLSKEYNKEWRAKDVITNITTVVTVPDASFYKKGDSVWVHITTNTVTKYTHFKNNPISFRKFVLE